MGHRLELNARALRRATLESSKGTLAPDERKPRWRLSIRPRWSRHGVPILIGRCLLAMARMGACLMVMLAATAGGERYSPNRLDPVGMTLGLGAEIVETMQNTGASVHAMA